VNLLDVLRGALKVMVADDAFGRPVTRDLACEIDFEIDELE
jgi:hypothetical protein